jgi:E3 ubiquitin-protein ligase MARCH6
MADCCRWECRYNSRDKQRYIHSLGGSWEKTRCTTAVAVIRRMPLIRGTKNDAGNSSFYFSLFRHRDPLFNPCKCSGSIGLTHQGCLQSWLEVQRGDGKCELCKTKFQFAPRYSDGAPDQLPPLEVFYGLSRRLVSRWLPFVLRILFAATLWLVVAPLVTVYLYQAWMHKPSFVMERMKWSLVLSDLISGVVVVGCVILSFLSLISLADFLREEWQRNGLVQGGDRRRPHERPGAEEEPHRFPALEEDVDNGLWDHVQQEILAQPPPLRAGLVGMNENDDAMHLESRGEADAAGGQGTPWAGLVGRPFAARPGPPVDDLDFSDSSYDDNESVDDDDVDDDEDWHDEGIDRDEVRANEIAMEQADRVQAQAFNNDAMFDNDPEDPGDAGINIALDEILGVRGPLSTVVQNLLWLLAFNAVYLGFFTFTPRVMGASILSLAFNVSAPIGVNDDNTTLSVNTTENLMSPFGVFKTIEYQSARLNTAFRIRDVLTIVLGYLSTALMMIMLRGLWIWSKNLLTFYARRRNRDGDLMNQMRMAFDDLQRLGLANDNVPMDDHEGFSLTAGISIALDAGMAIMKVWLLLFMKMFLLPIVLGVALDACTVDLLGGTIEDRILYAGKDLFSSLLVHWVAGITFMLLVTVSVLQLREVMHPDLLSQVIRPQEPQPDLLGNLLHETAATHAKRMLLSLIIYSALLYLQVRFPVQFVLSSSLGRYISLLKLKFCYIMVPELQVPLELLVFHLCMLAMLERYKNSIGEIQHNWLKFLCNQLGLTNAMLPRGVDTFRLVGSRQIFSEHQVVDEFWYLLSGEEKEAIGESVIQENCGSFRPPLSTCFNPGETKASGERLLKFGSSFIRLPKRLPGRAHRSRSVLLPTKFGRYRLKRDLLNSMDPVIQLWEEVSGAPIARPPEGWDDLGAGGADVQGRWAWAREKRSTIERGVARRQRLFYKGQGFFDFIFVAVNIILVVLLSWLATTCFLASVLGGPWAIGRALYIALGVPDQWIHDPFGFAVGSLIFFPAAKKLASTAFSMDSSLLDSLQLWIQNFRVPPTSKVAVLVASLVIWIGVAPVLLGSTYELAFVKDSDWFSEGLPFVDSWATCWGVGMLLLNLWGYCCAAGIFTRGFWLTMFDDRGVVHDADIGVEADDHDEAWVNVGDNHVRLRWQGKDGRITAFYRTLKLVLFNWEWDKVDHTVLLGQFALPVFTELMWIRMGPHACLYFCLWRFPALSGYARLVLVRSILSLTCLFEVLSAFQEDIASWFAVAHQTARDDRYLVGQVLLNYDGQSSVG